MRLALVGLWLLTGSAMAAGRTLVLGGGNCDDSELVGYVRSFTERLRPKMADTMVELNAASEKLRRSSRSTVEDVNRQVEAAQAHFYASEMQKAQQLIDEAMKDIEALPPGADRIRLQRDGWLLRMMIAREQKQKPQAEEAMRRVLRLDPDFKLDPVYFSGTARAEFDQERARMKKDPKRTLIVRSSPAGADVFLDGYKVGKTPFTGAFPAGTYALVLGKGELLSFERQIELRGEVQQQVDLDFEGSVRTRPIPCVHEMDDGALLTKAVRVGSAVDVEQVVLFKVERPNAGPTWVTAALVSVERGQKTREAGFKARGDAQSESALKDLADFVTTGAATKNVVVVSAAEAKPAPWEAPRASARTVSAASQPLTLPGLPHGTGRWMLIGGGGAAVLCGAGAGVVRLLAQSEIDALQARLSPSGAMADGDTEAIGLQQSLGAKSTVINVLVGGAVVGAAVAVTGLLLPAGPAPTGAVVPVDGGGMVVFGGSF